MKTNWVMISISFLRPSQFVILIKIYIKEMQLRSKNAVVINKSYTKLRQNRATVRSKYISGLYSLAFSLNDMQWFV